MKVIMTFIAYLKKYSVEIIVAVVVIAGFFAVFYKESAVAEFIGTRTGQILLEHPELTVKQAEEQARQDYRVYRDTHEEHRQTYIDKAKEASK